MPRPRISPEDRLRGVQACTTCRASKKRCNGESPCSNCHRRGLDDTCTFAPATTPTSSTHYQHKRAKSKTNVHSQDTMPQSREADVREVATAPSDASSADSTDKGESVAVNSSASLALLQFMKDVVKRNIGQTDFSQQQDQESGDTAGSSEPPPSTDLGIDLVRIAEYVDAYFDITTGIIFPLERAEITQLLLPVSTSLDPSQIPGLVCAVVAVGAQTVTDPGARHDEHAALALAQKAAFAGMLESQTLQTVQIFLLLSMYMLTAGRRDAVFMYLGIAARAAMAIDLASSFQNAGSKTVMTARRFRTWQSLFNMDLLVSTMRGRPTAVEKPQLQVHRTSGMEEDLSMPYLAVDATFHLSEILSNIVNDLYGNSNIKASAANSFLQSLQEWRTTLPSEICLQADGRNSPIPSREQVLASLHISTFYYNVVMLVTRPFMISHLVKKLATHRRKPSDAGSDRVNGVSDGETTMLAHACTNAAIWLAQGCHDVLYAGRLLARMPLIESRMFTAALVLGFRMFAAADQDWEIEEAFKGAQAVLEYFAKHSPQAAEHAEVLRSLFRAILRQRQVLTSRNREKSGSIVGKITAAPLLPACGPIAGLASSARPNAANGDAEWLHDFTFLDDTVDFDDGNAGLPWQNLSAQMWDNFLQVPDAPG